MLALAAVLTGCQDGMPPVATATPVPQATATATLMPEPTATPVGGSRLVLQAEALSDKLISPSELDEARSILLRRIEKMDVVTSSVQVESGNKLVVEMRGLDLDEEDAARLVRTGLLEIVDGGSEPLTPGYVITTTLGPATPEQVEAGGTYTGDVEEFRTIISGEDIQGDKVEVTRDQAGQPMVTFTLNAGGAQKLAEFTEQSIGNYMPIVLDKMVISVPIIRSTIPSGEGVISGLSLDEAKALAGVLASGTLPVKLTLLEIEQIR
jgi:preprotein translocase subunit SecD